MLSLGVFDWIVVLFKLSLAGFLLGLIYTVVIYGINKLF